jgi:dTDP-4-amino-4,6-dideoxygalactose transaminase
MNIEMVDLRGQYKHIQGEIEEAVLRVLRSGRFIGGEEVASFEREAAAYVGAKHAIGCASGTDALLVAMMAIGIRPGDEVITSPFTFAATAETIALLGAIPVYADIDERTYNIDPARMEEKITSKTRAIIPVHLYGQPAAMDEIMAIAGKHSLRVIEDAAQAFGAEYKGKKACTIGDIACVSFYPSKNLGAYGDAGLIVTNDDTLAASARMICNHGQGKTYYHDVIGVNSRLDSIQAAILRIKLRHLTEWNAARNNAARLYDFQFSSTGIASPYCAERCTHIYHQYSIRVPRRDAVTAYLKEQGIPFMIYYPVPLHLQPAYKQYGGKQGDYPVTERVAKEILSLPMHSELTEEQVAFIARTVIEATETIETPA